MRPFDTDPRGAGDDVYPLPAAGWHQHGKRTDAGRLKYRAAPTAEAPCKLVVVRPTMVKAVCNGSGIMLEPPASADVAIVLTLGAASKRYCARFGGRTTRNTRRLLKRAKAPLSVEGAVDGSRPRKRGGGGENWPAPAARRADVAEMRAAPA